MQDYSGIRLVRLQGTALDTFFTWQLLDGDETGNKQRD
jgi:hypothetical protein